MIKMKTVLFSIMWVGLAVLLATGCQKKESSIKKIKEITLSEENQKYIDKQGEALDDSKDARTASVDYGDGVVVSLSVPKGWRTDSSQSDVNKEYSSISAYHYDYPQYDLDVEIDDAEGDYKFLKKLGKKIDTLDVYNIYYDIKSIKKQFQKVYQTFLKKEEYPKWLNVSFGNTTLNGQCYITAKGQEKNNNKKQEEKGKYRYITFYKGKMLKFDFTAKNPKIDESVTAIFDSIMQTVTYGQQDE